MNSYMPKNEILPKIYQTRQNKHACLKSGPYMSKMIHTCILHNVCFVDTQDLHCGNTSSVLWKHKICIMESQDLHYGNTRSVV